jgi:phosphoribosylanthranilate isomerase
MDAMAAVAAGADAIGLNFYPGSKRFIDHLEANFICCDLPRAVHRVGVFVNNDAREIKDTASQLQLDWVQLHGDESVEYINSLKGLRVLRAVRVSADELPTILGRVQQLQEQCPAIKGFLLDAHAPNEFGGTGAAIDWARLGEAGLSQLCIPWVLAGGLTPENVEAAISAVKPHAVDVASGIESEPRKKDRDKMCQFAAHALRAFQRCPPPPTS